MGLSDFFRRLTGRNSDEQVIERAEEETRMSADERAYDQEDYEAKKDDAYINLRTWAGSGAEESARDDLDSL